MRFLRSLMPAVAGLCAFLCMFATIAHITVTTNTTMLQGFYQFADTSPRGVPASAYPDYSKAITEYLLGKRDSLTVTAADGTPREGFSEKELAHMADVRGLVQGLSLFRYIAGGLALILGALYWVSARKKESREQIFRGLMNGAAAGAYLLLGAILALALWGAFNFTGLFVTFHKAFFHNDLWLLNPRQDLLIMLMPTPFFIWYAKQIALSCWPVLAMMAALIAASLRLRNTRSK